MAKKEQIESSSRDSEAAPPNLPPGVKLVRTLRGHTNWIGRIAWSPDGRMLASPSDDRRIHLWDAETGKCLRTLKGQMAGVWSVAFDPAGRTLASGGFNVTVKLWEVASGRLLRTLQGHQNAVNSVAFDSAGGILASGSWDKTIKLWEVASGRLLRTLEGHQQVVYAIAFYPSERILASGSGDKTVKLWEVASGRLLRTLEGHTGTVRDIDFLSNGPLMASRSGDNTVRLWNCDTGACLSTMPEPSTGNWPPSLAFQMKKFLVSARADRRTVSVSKERLESLLAEFGFDGYFETSAKEGWQIKELRQAIELSISWDVLPEVASSVLFADIKAFLLDVKKTGRLVAPASELYADFARAHPKVMAREPNLSAKFDTCIGRLENRDLIRRLSFGGYVLLQPELLDAYASAMVNAAKKEPDGLGSVAEDAALAGQFYVPDEQKVKERGQEQLLLHATVEELVRHDLALRESAEDGRYLVFPSEFIRDYEAAPEPKGKALAVTFDGPVQSLYSTLAVRLGHSGLFTTGRAEMWRNAAVFTAKAGGKCGLYLHEFAEARGRLVIFYDQHEGQLPSDETRFHFEEFVLAHARRRALDGTVEIVRFFVCANGHPVPDEYVRLLRDQGTNVFDCPCKARVSLAEPKERLRYASKVAAMEQSADRERNVEMFIESARGEMSTPSFIEWVGDDRATLAIVFTDVVGSTALGEELKDERMSEMQQAHFTQSQWLIEQFKGREIKTIGDSVMAAFRSVEKALDYARALQSDPGPAELKIRAGIHIGPMIVKKNDVSGGAVNFAARVVGAIKGAEIWLSSQAKEHLDRGGARQNVQLKWERHDDVQMKGFTGTFTLWSLNQ